MKVIALSEKDGINGKSHRKENNFVREYACINKVSELHYTDPIIVRIYQTDSRVYACLWINHHPVYASGSGWAGGYGYHKESAAVASAIRSAGITMDQDISGVGESAIVGAIGAIARYLNLTEYYIHIAHA